MITQLCEADLRSVSACSPSNLSTISSSSSGPNKILAPLVLPSPTPISPSSNTRTISRSTTYSTPTVTTTSTANDRFWPSTSTTTGSDRIETQHVTLPAYGLAYNAYINPFNIDNDPTWRDDFASQGPSYFNTNNNTNETNYLVTCGIAHDIRIYNDDIYTSINGYLPGQTTLTDLEHIALIFHGYFLPPTKGTYTFSANSDDWGYIWLGASTAQTGWNQHNWIASNRAGGPTVAGLWTVDEAAVGVPVPATFLYANAGQRCACWFGIVFPDGTQVESFEGLFVQPLVGTWSEWAPAVLNVSTCPAPLAYEDVSSGVRLRVRGGVEKL